MNDEAKSGADPLDKRNPLRTGNFNKIVLWVFVFMVVAIVIAIAVIKLGIGGVGHRDADAPKTSQVVLRSWGAAEYPRLPLRKG